MPEVLLQGEYTAENSGMHAQIETNIEHETAHYHGRTHSRVVVIACTEAIVDTQIPVIGIIEGRHYTIVGKDAALIGEIGTTEAVDCTAQVCNCTT